MKQGREGAPEVVVSRVLSALGYHQPPVYFLPSFTVVKGGHSRLEDGGRFRLSLEQWKHRGYWRWEDSPFVGTPPYQTLLVVLAVLNSADLKDVNNALYEVTNSAGSVDTWFVVRDLGTSLGAIGRFDPTPNDPQRFSKQRFILGVSGGYVQFNYGAVHRRLMARITPADVRRASALLGGLSDRQWREAFHAGWYTDEWAASFISRIRQKIDESSRVGLD